MTQTLDETDLARALDDAIPCEVEYLHNGDSPAVWVVHYYDLCGCGGDNIQFACAPCLEEMLADESDTLTCDRCDVTVKGPWRKTIQRIEPIKGG